MRRFVANIGWQKIVPVAYGLHKDEDPVQRERHGAGKDQL